MKKIDSNTPKSLLLALAIFTIAGILYFLPALQGKTLSQGDITQFRGSASEIHQYREEGRQIYWTNVMFAGMPNFAISVHDSGNIIRFIPRAVSSVLKHPISVFVLMCIGFYVLMMALGIDARLAIICSLAYVLSTYFIVVLSAGHNSKFHAMAYLPGILAGMIWVYQQRKWWTGTAVFCLFTALEINANHPQMFYYFTYLIVAVVVYELIKSLRKNSFIDFVKGSALLLLAGIIAVGTQSAYFQRTLEYSKHSTRGESELSAEKTSSTGLDMDYITNWSYGVSETFSWLIPNYKGGVSQAIGSNEAALENIDPRFKQAVASQSQYFGNQPFVGGPVYVGAVILLFAIFGMFYYRKGFKIPLIITLVLMTMLSWGKNFETLTDFFINNIPLYNKFRAVSSIMVIPSFLLPLFAAISLNKLLRRPDTLSAKSAVDNVTNQKLFYVISGIILVFCAISYVAPGVFNSFMSDREAQQLPAQLQQAGFNQSQSNQFIDSLRTARQAIFKADVGRTLFLILLSVVLFWFWSKRRLSTNVFSILVGLLILGDLWLVDRRYLSSENFTPETKQEVQKTPADELILRDKGLNYRVLNLTVSPFNDATTSFFHKSIGGYSGIKMKKYQELVDYYLQDEIQHLSSRLQSQEYTEPAEVFEETPILNMLNMKYLIINKQGAPLINTHRLGNAWFVNDIKHVSSADEELLSLGSINPAQTAVVRKDQLQQIDKQIPIVSGNSAKIKLTSYDPEKLVYNSSSNEAGLVVFSEIYYPEKWKLYIDGEPYPLIRTNYLLRGAVIPAGNHEIRMEFEAGFGTANTVSLIASIVLFSMLITVAVRGWRQQKGNPKNK